MINVERVKAFLKAHNLLENYLEFQSSSATVDLAAAVIGCEPGRIVKSLCFQTAKGPVVICTMGRAKVDNKKYKDFFGEKATFPKLDEVAVLTGHPVGGVCPFALNEGVKVFLDESLKQYDTVYPAAGAPNNAVKLTVEELEKTTGAQWIDVCKPM